MNLSWNVIQNNNTKEKNVDFTPKKNKESDIAYDIRAFNIKGQEFDTFIIPAKSSIVVGTGVSIIQEDNILIPNHSCIQYLMQKIENLERQIVKGLNINDFNQDKISLNTNYNSVEFFERFYPSSEMHSRSGLAFKSNILCFNGQIDNEYGDQIKVKLTNNSYKDFILEYGMRIGQLEIKLVPEFKSKVNYVKDESELNNGKRGGFGSSGLQ